MIEDHEEDIKEFKEEAASGEDADAKAYAAARDEDESMLSPASVCLNPGKTEKLRLFMHLE
jgi:hypothetical protein